MKFCLFPSDKRREEEESGIENQTEELQSKLLSHPEKPIDEASRLLEHARELFIYWAGQRLVSIRYFLLAFTAAAIVYVDIYTDLIVNGNSSTHEALILVAIGLFGAGASIMFLGLDLRNVELVESAERAMDVVERAIARQLGYCSFQTTMAGNKPKCRFLQYSHILPAFFAVCFSVSAFGCIFAMFKVLG